MADYTQMWSDLGLDLKAYDALLSILGGAYQDIFLSQKDRPEGMKYFETDYSQEDAGQLKTRIEIFHERIEGR